MKNIEGKVAIGDAVTVPAGKYANQALNTIGLYTGAAGDDGVYTPEFAGRVALADKVGTAAKYVSTGDPATRPSALSTAPTSSATTGSSRLSSVLRTPINPSSTPVPFPPRASMPKRRPTSSTSA